MVAAISPRQQLAAASGPAALARWPARGSGAPPARAGDRAQSLRADARWLSVGVRALATLARVWSRPRLALPVRWPAPGGHWFSAGDPAPAAGARPAAMDEMPPPAAPEPAAPPSDPPGPAAPPPPDDTPLLQAARRGDLQAFNALVLRYERVVFNVCLRLLRDPASAEDVTQETFVKAWTSLATFKGEHLRPWLFRIATNRCYDLLRVRGRRPAVSLDAEPFEREPVWSSHAATDEAPEAHTLRQELSIYMERALAALPADQRAAVLLADVHGCDYGEIAAATDAALGTVKSRISRARARLRQMLQDDPEAGELFDRYSRHFDDQGEASRR